MPFDLTHHPGRLRRPCTVLKKVYSERGALQAKLHCGRCEGRDGTLEPFLTPGEDESRLAAPPSPAEAGEGGAAHGCL